MIRFTQRQLAATMVLAASAWLMPSLAGEATPATPAKPYVMQKKVPAVVRKAVESPNRSDAMKARDADRKPGELLWLANVKAGSRVIELGSVGQYFTTIMSEIVGPKGMVYMYDMPDTEPDGGEASKAFAAAHPNTQYQSVDFNKIEFPKNIDVVISIRYFHEMLLRGTQTSVFHTKLFKALRPGGIYLVVDHTGKLGVDMRDTLPLHRIDPTIIRQYVGGDGFELVEDSRLLENLADDKSWSVYTEGKRDQTDQTVYVFRKPIVY